MTLFESLAGARREHGKLSHSLPKKKIDLQLMGDDRPSWWLLLPRCQLGPLVFVVVFGLIALAMTRQLRSLETLIEYCQESYTLDDSAVQGIPGAI